METIKNDQTIRLTTFLSGDSFQLCKDKIIATSHPMVIRTHNDTPWLLTTDEVETILHEHAPELSATVSGPTIVIFHEKRPAN